MFLFIHILYFVSLALASMFSLTCQDFYIDNSTHLHARCSRALGPIQDFDLDTCLSHSKGIESWGECDFHGNCDQGDCAVRCNGGCHGGTCTASEVFNLDDFLSNWDGSIICDERETTLSADGTVSTTIISSVIHETGTSKATGITNSAIGTSNEVKSSSTRLSCKSSTQPSPSPVNTPCSSSTSTSRPASTASAIGKTCSAPVHMKIK